MRAMILSPVRGCSAEVMPIDGHILPAELDFEQGLDQARGTFCKFRFRGGIQAATEFGSKVHIRE